MSENGRFYEQLFNLSNNIYINIFFVNVVIEIQAIVGNLAFKLILKGLSRELACRLSSGKVFLTCGCNVDGKLSTVSSAIC